MKTIITVAISLFALNAMAVNTSRTWHSRGETLQFVGKQLSISGFASKTDAVEAALGMAEELQSGDISRSTAAKFRNSPTLWDSNDKCASSHGINFNIIEREMAKGNFKVISIKVGSYFTGTGTEVFSYGMRAYVPCVKKSRN